jgi:Fe-Mn family superoxide dismutase
VVLHEQTFDNLGGSGQAGATEWQVVADVSGRFDVRETEFRRIPANQQPRQLEDH